MKTMLLHYYLSDTEAETVILQVLCLLLNIQFKVTMFNKLLSKRACKPFLTCWFLPLKVFCHSDVILVSVQVKEL